MNEDAELLRRYAEDGSQVAFTALVQRHLGLVYAAALRRTGGDQHLAADVAQHVFTTVARDARKLSRHTVLSAWMHTATRNAALNLMISEQRRKARELAAAADSESPASSEPAWEQLRPVLDAAIDELPEADRAVVVLRFLERQPFSRIGAALRVSEDAARMRTERALDKLRDALAHRGITSTAAALATVVSGQVLVGAPAGLAASVAKTALAAAIGSVGLTAFLSSLMTSKIIATALVTSAVAFAAGGYLGFSRAIQEPLPPAPELPQHSQTIASLRKEVDQLKADRDQLSASHAKLTADLRDARATRVAATAPSAASVDMETAQVQRAVMNNLRQLNAAIEQFSLDYKRSPASLDELVGEKKYIRRLIPVDGESYSSLVLNPGQPLAVVTAKGVTVTFDKNAPSATRSPEPPSPAMQRAQELMHKAEPAMLRALAAYKTANPGKNPPNPEALLPYFATPQEGADFVEAVDAQKAAKR